MSDYTNEGYALDWDAEIENEGTPFVVAEPGDYNFTVVNFERARFNGSAKMPPCNQAKLTLKLDMPDGQVCEVKHNIFLHSKTEWRLCEFFTAIGQRKHGQKVSMNWNAVIGANGRCKITKRKFTNSNTGKEMEANDVEKFYEPAEDNLPFTYPQTSPQMAPQKPQSYGQQGYAQPQQGYAPPQGYAQPQPYAAPSGGGYVPGKF